MEPSKSSSTCYDSAIEMTPNPSPTPTLALARQAVPLLPSLFVQHSPTVSDTETLASVEASSSQGRFSDQPAFPIDTQETYTGESKAIIPGRLSPRDNETSQYNQQTTNSTHGKCSVQSRFTTEPTKKTNFTQDRSDSLPKRQFASIKDIKSAFSNYLQPCPERSRFPRSGNDSFFLEPVEKRNRQIDNSADENLCLPPKKGLKSRCYNFIPQPSQIHSEYLLPKSFFRNRRSCDRFENAKDKVSSLKIDDDEICATIRTRNTPTQNIGEVNVPDTTSSSFNDIALFSTPVVTYVNEESSYTSPVNSISSQSENFRTRSPERVCTSQILQSSTSRICLGSKNSQDHLLNLGTRNNDEDSGISSRITGSSTIPTINKVLRRELNNSPSLVLSTKQVKSPSKVLTSDNLFTEYSLATKAPTLRLSLRKPNDNNHAVNTNNANITEPNTGDASSSLGSSYKNVISSFPIEKNSLINFSTRPKQNNWPSKNVPHLHSNSSQSNNLHSDLSDSSGSLDSPPSRFPSSNIYPETPQSMRSASPSMSSSRCSSPFLYPEPPVDDAKGNVIGHVVEHLFRDMLLLWCRQTQAFRTINGRDTESDRTVYVSRASGEFGFRIHGSRPVVVSAIEVDTPAETSGLEVGDIVLTINDISVLESSHSEVVKLAHSGGCDTLKLEVARTCNLLAPLITTDPTPVCAGYLYKLGAAHRAPGSSAITRRWHRRWFALTKDHCLYHYKREGDPHPLGAVVLRGHTVHAFSTATRPYAFTVSLAGEVGLQLAAHSAESRGRWGHVITQASEQAAQRDELLEASARRVQQAPGSIATPDCFGYLQKLGARWHQWKKRYCVLKDACLYLYHDTDATQAIGVVHLHGYRVQSTSIGGKKHAFELIPPDSKFRHLYFHSDSDYDKKRWLAAFEYSIDRWIKLA